eukprot:TRINITY_DN8548_c0_g3_i3.p1 TRINITY_DN8548_c0_g3~~TRINITY_DN8548_c0_g3_i3.p1  ORF type:complete len:1290 (+),score=355.63 TRINITY_DN8548_c0_g3_i3:32-3871(+)
MAGRAAKLPNFLASHLAGANVPVGASRQFCQLIKAVGESGTNHEEGRIIAREKKLLEQKLKEPNISKKQMKEYLVRLMYCEMLGHEVDFGYIHAVKFTQHSSLFEKRVGYLAVGTLLHEDHELILLLVNTIQRDLKSTNVVEMCMALNAVCRLINAEMIPAVLSLVEDKLTHSREIVRKKAVLCIHRFLQKSASSVMHMMPKIRKSLCDQDPGVMAASLNIFYDLALEDAAQFKDLTSSFVSILKQIIEHRLPRDFDYHKVPAPWLQIKLMKILALLGADDQSASEAMYEVLRDTMRRADIQSTIAYAVMYECVLTVAKIYPSSQLMEIAASNVGRFLRSGNNNLKYLGITALASIVSVNPIYAADYKGLVIDCLDDPDETLKRKTLDLLCKMTNPANVKVIVDKLVGYLKSTVDVYLRKDLVPRIIQLADRFSPDNVWYVETMNSLFRTAGDLVSADIANNLMRLIAEGTEDDDEDEELRVFAASSYIDLLEVANLPDVLVQTMAWVVGEYAYLAADYDQEVVLELMGELLDRSYQSNAVTKGWILSAIVKLIAQTGLCPAPIKAQLQSLTSHASVNLQQRAVEALALLRNGTVMQQVFPTDASCEDLEVNPDLPFLDGVVAQALAQGHSPYKPAAERAPKPQAVAPQPEASRLESAFKFEAYDAPVEPANEGLFAGIGGRGGSNSGASSVKGASTPASGASTPVTGRKVIEGRKLNKPSTGLQVTKKRWGRAGDLTKKAEPKSASPAESEAASEPSQVAAEPIVQATVPKPEPVRPSEPEPEEDTEKKRLADSLFATEGSGTGSSTSGGNRAGKSRASRAKKGRAFKAKAASNSSPQPSGGGDLLSLDSGAGMATTSNSNGVGGGDLLGDLAALDLGSSSDAMPPPPAYADALNGPKHPSSNDMDLLGGLGLDMPASSSAASTPAVAGLDLLGSMDMTPSSASSVPVSASLDLLQPTSSATTTASMDLLGGSSSSGTTNGTAVTGLASLDALGSQATSAPVHAEDHLPDDLAALPHEPSSSKLNADANVHLAWQRVWRDDALDVVLFIRNVSSSSLDSVVTRVDAAGGLVRSGANAHENRFSDRLGVGAVKRYVVSYTATQVKSGMAIKGQVTYTLAGKQRNMHYTGTVTPRDVLRPFKLQTAQFGQLWQATGSQRSMKVQSQSVASVEQLNAKMDQVNIHCVQVIGNEVIFSGKVRLRMGVESRPSQGRRAHAHVCSPVDLGQNIHVVLFQVLTNEQQPCLVHIKLNAPVVDVQVHSHSTPFTETMLKQLEDVLSS